jgi:predicted nucleotidyltransferase
VGESSARPWHCSPRGLGSYKGNTRSIIDGSGGDKAMRLTDQQAQLIKNRVRRYFGANTKVWLFGSRVDDGRKGGDVDLYIEPEFADLTSELKCKIDLEDDLDLHVDLVINLTGKDDPIYGIAKNEGIRL